MKVADIASISSDVHTSQTVQDKRADMRTGHGFQRRLSALNDQQHRKYIEDLNGRITKQGEVIAKKADIKELQKYRQLIQELFGDMASNAYTCTKSNAFDARGRHKALVIIRSVNKTLDKMAKEIVEDQADNLKLLEMVDDIRGLLVDLFL